MATKLTALQREVLVRVFRSTREGAWYRAQTSGERVTLASLYTRGLLTRQARRGVEGEANSAYEYRLSELVVELLR